MAGSQSAALMTDFVSLSGASVTGGIGVAFCFRNEFGRIFPPLSVRRVGEPEDYGSAGAGRHLEAFQTISLESRGND